MRLRFVTAAVVLIGGSAGSLYYRQREIWQAAAKNPPPPAIVAVEKRRIQTSVNATGILRLMTGAEVKVGTQISGVVTQLNVGVGSHVTEGDLIAVIASRGLDERIAAAKAQIEIDDTAVHKIDRELKRSHALLEYGLIPRQQAEDLEEDLANAQAKLAKSRRDLAVIQSDLPYLQIRAPITGTVASVSTLQGETVAASFTAPTFVTIIADDALELVAMVDETDIANVKPGDPASFTVDAYPARDFPGIVRSIAPKATIVSGVVNYEVTIHIGTDAKLLKPDMTANVTIRTAQHRAFMLPADAVQSDGDRSVVYILENSGPVRREVVTGSRNQGEIEIRKGITKEDKVLLTAAFSTPARGNQ